MRFYESGYDGYITDCVHEFADNNTSIYYNDQREYYYNNSDACMNALKDCGYSLDEFIKEGYDLDDLICKAGAIGEYNAIYNELWDDVENILKLKLIDLIIEDINKNDDCIKDFETIKNFIDEFNFYNLQEFDELDDALNELKETEK